MQSFLSHRRLQFALRAATVCAWLLLAVLSLLPGSERPHTGAPGNAEHMLAYALTALATGLAFDRTRPSYIVAALVLLAGAFEMCQIWIPGRGSALDNWLASGLGAVIGV